MRTPSAPELAMSAAYSASAVQGALDRLRGEPAGRVDALAEPDDLHPPAAVGVATRRAETSATSRRMELVPQSIAATRLHRLSDHRGRSAWPAHQSPQLRALVAEGVDARPDGQRVRRRARAGT